MEDKNFFTAIVLSILVFVVWYSFFMPAPQELPPADQTHKEVMEKPEEKVSTFDKTDSGIIDTPIENITTTMVKSPLYEITLSNLGGVVKQVCLKDYKETNKPDSGMKTLMDPEKYAGSYGVEFKNKSIPELEKTLFNVSEEQEVLNVQDGPKTLTYTYVSEKGIIVEKTFVFKPDTYLINYSVTIKNASEYTFSDDLIVNLTNRLMDKSRISFQGPALYVDKELKQVSIGDIDEENRFKGNIKWASIEDRYFMISLIPEQTVDTEVLLSYNENDDIIASQLVKSTGTLAPGVQKVFEYSIYNGPKDLSILRSIGKNNIEKVVNFGWFDILAKPCLMLMDLIYHNVISNYGVAIILLTLLFKIILWPLGNKSYKSMNDMKKLQPLVSELREKYKNDKQQMNVELMNLYKTYKVNPLSGCLPMLVQMPIFFAFYRMLYSAIELRHAPFVGWIKDLSAPDRLFNFQLDFTIPFFDPPYGIPVLTLLMGASMFLQQKMSPPAGDPTQAKMMMMMPVFMTFIFMNFSSGLVLYWFVNNVVSISQQYYIMKKNA